MIDQRLDAEQIFNAARTIDSPSERIGYLKGVCGSDTALRENVDALLKSNAEVGSFLESAAPADPDATLPQSSPASPSQRAAPRTEQAGQMIGRYKLLQLIGEGGFGSVFMAEQREPVVRKVALKIIKLGMDTRQVIARFEAERQALALMDHPNIAKVLDAGATEAGRPYFVMELVKGDPITEYADKNNLTVRERLDLLLQVCNAIQHAHQKGIIHRDIKPNNVLVSTQDGRPHAKVIDFGIAKATASRLTEMTLFTEHHQLIGTPQYMSPEQADGSLDIDTRTDVYALGVLLYELLTGATPFDGKRLRSAAYGEMQRIIREEEPSKPSRRLSQLIDTLPNVAAHRRIEPRRLSPLIRGELDWIVMKALEKDRARRYETANGLGLDVQRYLSGEAVVAAPSSTSYRVRKLLRRNKGPVAAAAAVLLTLFAGVVGFAWQAHRIGIERDAAIAARTAEEQERRKSDAINEFIRTALQSSDPNLGGQQGMLVTDAMLKAATLLDEGALKNQPEVDGGLRLIIADILKGNGRFSEALPMAERALAVFKQLHPNDDANVAAALGTFAQVLQDLGRASDAEPFFVQALEMRQRIFNGDHPAVAESLNNLAAVLQALGRLREAEPFYVKAVEMNQRMFKGDHRDVATGLNNLAFMKDAQGLTAEAEAIYAQALQMRRRLFKGDHPDVARSLTNVATARHSLGRAAEALPLATEALEMNQRLFKGDHPAVARTLNNLASVRQTLNGGADAEPLYIEALEMRQRLYKGDNADVAQSLNTLAAARHLQGRSLEAEPMYIQSLEMRQRLFRGDNADVARSLNNVASVTFDLGRAADAEPLYVQALEMRQRLFKGDHTDVAQSLSGLANTRRVLGRANESEPMLRDALAMNARLHPGDDSRTAYYLRSLALTLAKLDRLPEAFDSARQAAEMAARTTSEGNPIRKRCDDTLIEIQRECAASIPIRNADTPEAR